MNFTLGDLMRATSGALQRGNENTPAGPLCTDTRSIKPGETFVALSGKNFRGEDFIPQALARGASAVIATTDAPENLPVNCAFLKVADTTLALGDIARAWRRKVNPTVIAVTGSAGKTTTKEMLAFICRGQVSTLATEGNLNNLIGLPLTLLRLREGDKIAVIEVGMNQPGELTELTHICLPDITVITNIGNAHIGNFGSLEALIQGESEIFAAMPRGGMAIFNADCPLASRIPDHTVVPPSRMMYGQKDCASIRATNIRQCAPLGYEFDLHFPDVTREVRLGIYGSYQISNALAAASAAYSAGIHPDVIADRLSVFEAPRMMRSQTEWFDGFFIIADCYNASPDAMMKSVASLRDVTGLDRRVALLGDMLELGDYTESLHRQVGATAAKAAIDCVVTVGETSELISAEARAHGVEAHHFKNPEEAAHFLSDFLQVNDGLLVKGSRGARMENVLARLKEVRAAARHLDYSPVPLSAGH